MQSCAQPDAQTPRGAHQPDEVLYRDSQCGGNIAKPAAVWINDQQALTRFAEAHFLNPSKPLPTVNFPNEGVLFIAMGQRPTAGYGLGFSGNSTRIDGNTLEVTVFWQEPPPGYRLAQVVTSPCLMLKLPAGNFQRIRVLDQNGKVRAEASR